MKLRLRKIVLGIHFVALILVLLNFLLNYFTTYSLEGNIETGTELITLFSGLILFFFYFKPFRKISFYFSLYAILAFLTIGALVFRSGFLSLLLLIILHPFFPDEKKYEKDGIIIAVPFQGIMSSCCSYEIKERKLFFFEKRHGIFQLDDSINFETIEIETTDDEIVLIYSTYFDDKMNKTIIQKGELVPS